MRKEIQRLLVRFPEVLREAMGVRGGVLKASLSKTSKVCGKPNCKCIRGEKHVVYQLSWVEAGKRHSAHIRAVDLGKVEAAVERYRRLRRCRAELMKLSSEVARLLDELVDALSISFFEDGSGDGSGE